MPHTIQLHLSINPSICITLFISINQSIYLPLSLSLSLYIYIYIYIYIIFSLKNNNPLHCDNKLISILLKSIDIKQCTKKLTGFLQIKQENGFE